MPCESKFHGGSPRNGGRRYSVAYWFSEQAPSGSQFGLVWPLTPFVLIIIVLAGSVIGDLLMALSFEAIEPERVTLVTLIAMIVFVVLRIRSNKKSNQNLLSFGGILVTTIHYKLVALGYVTTELH